MKYPRPVNIGKRRKVTLIDGRHVQYLTVEEEIVRPQRLPRFPGGPHEKLIYLQKLHVEEEGKTHTEYRFTYYMKGFKGRTRGWWVFGQSSLIIPPKDLSWLLRAARARGWSGF